MDLARVSALLAEQAGVISRRQVLDCGGRDHDVQRLLRRREWARVHEGVYVEHTGPLTEKQRHWAAVLLHWPSALAGASALEAYGVRVDLRHADVELMVPRTRRVVDPPGVRTRQITDFASMALFNLGPPRVRIEHAALTVAADALTDDSAVAVLSDVVQQRRTTATRLCDHLEARLRLRRRRFLGQILGDIAAGTNSALERRYLLDVERADGLPVGERQFRVAHGRRTAYRDVYHPPFGSVFELDGRIGHDRTVAQWADLDRDVASAIAGDATVRLGWGQVLQPCRLATAVGTILGARGWEGTIQPCLRADCVVASTGEDPVHHVRMNLA